MKKEAIVAEDEGEAYFQAEVSKQYVKTLLRVYKNDDKCA